MAFPCWPGDGRLPSAAADTYFTTQALQAGYPVDPIARPDLAAPPPFSAREVLHREMQKERIREEYLSRELVHSRLLLDQQMRHQQEFEAAHRVVPDPVYSSLVSEFRALERLPVLAPHPVELGFRESLPPPVPGFVDARIHRRPGPRSKPAVRGRHSAALRPESVIRKGRHSSALRPESVIRKGRHSSALLPESVIRRQRPVGHRSAREHESKLPKKESGIKRKAATIEVASDPPSQDKSEWSCSICRVLATTEHDWKLHLNGRRHKVKQESLFCDVCNVRCTSKSMLDSHLNGKSHKEASATLSAKVVVAPLPVKEQQQANQQKQVVEKSSLNCDVCNLEYNSEFMLYEHLAGKKHKAKLMQRKAQGDKPVSAEDNICALPVKEQQQVVKKSSLNCDVCNLECNNEFMLYEHLAGKKHKAKLMQRKAQGDKPVSAEDNICALPVKEQQQVVEKSSLNCDVCNLECNSELMLYEHLAGKKHKAKLMQRKAQGDKPVSAEDNICALPVKEQQQLVEKSSLNCDVCNLECNSEFMLYDHLAGKKHKAKLMQLNKAQGEKPVPVEDNKLANDKQHEKAQDGVLVTAEGSKFANDKPVTAEQTGEDKSLVTADSSGQDGKIVTAEESGKSLTPVKGTKRRVVVKKVRRRAGVENVAVEEAVKTGQADTEVSVVGSVAAETTE